MHSPHSGAIDVQTEAIQFPNGGIDDSVMMYFINQYNINSAS